MNRPHFALPFFACIIVCSLWHMQSYAFSTLAKNDPYPIFSTSYPYDYLLDRTLNHLKGIDCEYCPEHFYVAFTPFYQKASRGSNYDREKNLPLGDLEGRWHMLGMLYGPVPGAGAIPPTLEGTQLGLAKLEIFNVAPADDEVLTQSIVVDPNEQLGFFSVPIKYRKHGVRFEIAAQPHPDFGILIQGGYADIKQTLTGLENRCPPDSTLCEGNQTGDIDFKTMVNELLMSTSASTRIFKEQCIDKISNTQNLCDFRAGSFEDLRFSVWARHVFELNRGSCEWPEFLFIPFFFFEASVSPVLYQDLTKALSVPFGNNGHSTIGFTSGFHIDFSETVEIGFQGGITHFFDRQVKNYRLPTHPSQSGVFPFATDVRLTPGNNHHFCVSLHAYRFIDKLSGWVQFTFVNHSEDKIKILDKDLAAKNVFLVRQQECLTKFTSQFLTTVGNYEISPNLLLGFGVQWPIQQRNAYRSTTVFATIKATY